MLTSAARETLAGVQTVIVDEVHAVAATKRGAHLALVAGAARRTAARTPRAAHRAVGDRAPARGGRAVPVRRAPTTRQPSSLPRRPRRSTCPCRCRCPIWPTWPNNTIWPDVEERIVDLIESHRSTIVFANSRRLAERLTARLNEIHAERWHRALELIPSKKRNPQVAGGAPAHIMGSGQTFGADPLLARAHHGSVSKEQRALVEDDLKSGRLKAVVATSSLELGIDMGAVDLVIQVEAPPSVASGLQRIGRAGHQVGEVSRGVLFPKHRTDLIGCAVSVQRMLGRRRSRPCECPPTRSTSWPSRPWRPARWSRWTPTTGSTPCAAAHRSRRCRAARSRPPWTCCPASTRPPSSPSCARGWSTTATPAR